MSSNHSGRRMKKGADQTRPLGYRRKKLPQSMKIAAQPGALAPTKARSRGPRHGPLLGPARDASVRRSIMPCWLAQLPGFRSRAQDLSCRCPISTSSVRDAQGTIASSGRDHELQVLCTLNVYLPTQDGVNLR